MSVIILMGSMRVAVLPGEFDELAGLSEDGGMPTTLVLQPRRSSSSPSSG